MTLKTAYFAFCRYAAFFLFILGAVVFVSVVAVGFAAHTKLITIDFSYSINRG